MENIDIDAIKRLLSTHTGPGTPWTPQRLSIEAGLKKDAVRDILRGSNKNPSAETVFALLRTLKVDLAELIGSVKPSAAEALKDPFTDILEVRAAVAAGVWREHIQWPADEWYSIRVTASPVRGERFAVKMEGHSMDKTIPPGSDLECLRVAFGRVEPQPGNLVVVQRTAHDLTELTCKRLDIDGEDWVLRAESTKPEFQEPIRLGRADRDLVTDDEIQIIGIVLSSQQRHFNRS